MTSQGRRVSGVGEAFDDLVLRYVLKKLTEVFEELLEVSKRNYPDNMAGMLELGQVKAAKKISGWLGRVRYSTPYQVTRALTDQMNDSQKLKNDLRFEAQAVLLEVLVEASLAMDAASYSEFMSKPLH
ncbi:hypothetical protein ACYZUD_00290 [Pseudomonas sp. XS1P51]